MKVLLDIKDEKASFIMEVLKNFKDVKTTPLTRHKADVLEGLKEAVEEVKLIKQGKLRGIPARELLDSERDDISDKELLELLKQLSE